MAEGLVTNEQEFKSLTDDPLQSVQINVQGIDIDRIQTRDDDDYHLSNQEQSQQGIGIQNKTASEQISEIKTSSNLPKTFKMRTKIQKGSTERTTPQQ